MMKKYVEADRRLERVFQGIWNTLVDDLIVHKLGYVLSNQKVEGAALCGTQFKECEMRMKETDSTRGTFHVCLCDFQGTMLKAFLLAKRRGYTFYPLGCLRLALAEATKIKDTTWTPSQKQRMWRELYEKK